MTAKSRKLRLPRKTVFIIGGALLLGGATGAFALYLTKDHFLGGGDDKKTVASLSCTTVKTFKIKKKDRYWVRKFIKTEPADGLVRVATALRVAEAVYTVEKPDLVQVVVLDQRGPEQRADMRGRAIGADVVYVPHPENIPELAGTPIYTAKYIDGQANDAGQFYGEKIQLPPEHIDSLVSMLTDHADCIDPAAPEGEKKGGEHGSEKKPAEGHGAEAAAPEGEAAPAHGEAPVAEAPAETPVAEAAGEAPVQHEAAAPDEAPATHEAAAPDEAPVHEASAPDSADEPERADVPAVSDEQTSAPGPRSAGHEAGKAAEPATEAETPAAAHATPAIVESHSETKPPVMEKAEPAKHEASEKPKPHAAKPVGKPESKADHGKAKHETAKAPAAAPEQAKAEPEGDFYDEPSVSGSE